MNRGCWIMHLKAISLNLNTVRLACISSNSVGSWIKGQTKTLNQRKKLTTLNVCTRISLYNTIISLILKKAFPVSLPHFFDAISSRHSIFPFKFVAISCDFTQLGFTLLRTFDCLYELTEFIGLIRWKLSLWFFVKALYLLLKPGSLMANISGALPFTAWRKEFPRTVATWHLVQTLSCCINALFLPSLSSLHTT